MVSSDVQTKLNFESFFDRFWKNKENAKCTYKNGVLKVKKEARVSNEEKKSRPRTELFSNHESTDNSKEEPKFRSRSELSPTKAQIVVMKKINTPHKKGMMNQLMSRKSTKFVLMESEK